MMSPIAFLYLYRLHIDAIFFSVLTDIHSYMKRLYQFEYFGWPIIKMVHYIHLDIKR